jgi:hypothetical protein
LVRLEVLKRRPKGTPAIPSMQNAILERGLATLPIIGAVHPATRRLSAD